MKKLMTMIAAVATAFGLYAAVDPADTGTSFEGATAGETLDSQKGAIQELPDFQATGLTYWANLDDTAVIKERDVAFENRPAQYSGKSDDLCLSLSTGSKVIQRYAKAGGATTEILNGALYFDSTVKMTVFDSDPEITATDAKLKIWLQEELDANGNPTATNLYVNGYKCGDDASALADTWVRVTARALKISSNQIGFIVYVDGEVVSTDATVAGLPETYIDDNVAEYGKNGRLFPSLTASTEIIGVGFAGMGSVDDLVFTKTAPSFVKDYEFYTIAANEHVTTFTANGQTWTSGNPLKFLFEGAGQVQVTAIEYENDYFGNTTTNLDVSAAGAYFVGDAKAHNFTVNVDGEQVKCATFADAVTAANGAKSIAMISLITDCNADVVAINNANVETTLDLAGKMLTGTVTYQTALKVMDSSSAQTGKIVPVGGASTENPAVAIVGEEWTVENEPTLTLESGIFDGTISTFVNMAVVTGGKFYDTIGEFFPPKGTNEWQEGDNTYKATWDEATSYWTVEQVTMCTVSINQGEGTTLTVKVGDEEVVDDTPVEAGTVLTISVAAAADYKDAKITVNGADYTEKTYTVNADVEIASSATACKYATAPTGKQEVVYTGNEQDGLEGGSNYEVSEGDAKGTNAGNYSVKVVPADDCDGWSDDKTSKEARTINWSIAPAAGKVEVTITPVTVKEGETYDVTVELNDAVITEGFAGVWTDKGGTVLPAAPTTEGEYTYTVTLVPGNYTGSDSATLTIEKAGPVIPEPEDLPEAEKTAYDNWYTSNPADPADVALTKPEDLKDAYLLGCKAGEDALEAARKEFKFASIEFVDDEWVATIKNSTGEANEFYGNGKIEMGRYSDVGCKEAADNGNFFKAKLDYKNK